MGKTKHTSEQRAAIAARVKSAEISIENVDETPIKPDRAEKGKLDHSYF